VNKINNISYSYTVSTVLPVYICTRYVLCDSESLFITNSNQDCRHYVEGMSWRNRAESFFSNTCPVRK